MEDLHQERKGQRYLVGIQSTNGEEETVMTDTKIQLRFPFQFPFKFGTVSHARFRGTPSWARLTYSDFLMGGCYPKLDEALDRYHLWREGKPDPHGINYQDIL